MASAARGIVLDANIIVRAVLGRRLSDILERFPQGLLHSPDSCLQEARKHVPKICQRRRFDTSSFLDRLNVVEEKLTVIPPDLYFKFEQEARARIQSRDPDDWPVIATALALDLPIWTEDRDFFGCGIPTWITNTIDIYLSD